MTCKGERPSEVVVGNKIYQVTENQGFILYTCFFCMGLGCPQEASIWVQAAGVQATRRERQVLAVGSECAVGSSEHENGEEIRGHVNSSLTAAPRKQVRERSWVHTGRGGRHFHPVELTHHGFSCIISRGHHFSLPLQATSGKTFGCGWEKSNNNTNIVEKTQMYVMCHFPLQALQVFLHLVRPTEF